MNPQTRLGIVGVSALLTFFPVQSGIAAQSSKWTASSGGSWSTAENWADKLPAAGVDAIATFAPTGSSQIVVSNDMPELVLGGIVIPSGTTKGTMISGGNIQLKTSTGVPTISLELPGNSAGINLSSTLSGNQGFLVKNAGMHRVQIGGNNRDLSGTITLNGGALIIGSNGAFGTAKLVLNGGTLNGNTGRLIPNDIVWNSGIISLDTTAGGGPLGSTLSLKGDLTLGSPEGVLISSAINAGNTHFFEIDGVLSSAGQGTAITISNGNMGGNLYVKLHNANTFTHQIVISQGGVAPAGGQGKYGSVGLLVGNDAALSTSSVTVQSVVSRFVLASVDAIGRTLANDFIWQTSESRQGSMPAYEFTFGPYVPVGADYTTPTAIGSVGGTGDIVIGGFEVNANALETRASRRRISVNGATTATIRGVLSRTGTLSASKMRIEKAGSGTLVLANAGNTFDGGFSVVDGTLIVDGMLAGTGLDVGSGAAIGGSGTISSNLDLYAYSGLVFKPGASLTVNGSAVTFGPFGVGNLIGIDSKVPEGTYTLIGGTAKIDAGNLSNVGEAQAQDIGGGKAAYFSIDKASGNLQLVVVKRRS